MTKNKKEKIKCVFIGTPKFSVPCLSSLAESGDFDLVLLVCGQDKKVGRKQEVCAPPTKICAESKNIRVLQPKNIREIELELRGLEPDIIVLVAYGQIMPLSILSIPKYGIVNVHGSLLPRYRGSSCIQAAIMNRDKESGITIMKMESGLDTGPIIHQEKIFLDEKETADSLYLKLSELAAKVLPGILKSYVGGNIIPREQDNRYASYVANLKKEDGRINWKMPGKKLDAFVRAMHSWPGAWTMLDDKAFKIIETGSLIDATDMPGRVVNVLSKMFVQCGDAAIEIKSIQMSGKNTMAGTDFLRGNPAIVNKIFG